MPEGRITYVGHATMLIELEGSSVLTDPLLRDRIGHVSRIAPSVPELPEPGAILLSHAHRDHLDLPSLRAVPASVPVYAPPAAAAVVRRTGRAVQAMLSGDRVRICGLDVLAVHALHDGRRMPVGGEREAIGFVINGSASVYFAGDTDLFEGMAQIGAPGLDVALLPIWGWGPRLPPGHLDPERAAEATRLLAPRVVIPIHWGTYLRVGLRRRDLEAPARAFAAAVARAAPDCDVVVLRPGESFNHP